MRSQKLKVFGVTLNGRNRVIAAVTSQKEFAKITGTSIHYIQGYAAETSNEEEIKLATSYCHVPWTKCFECGHWSRDIAYA